LAGLALFDGLCPARFMALSGCRIVMCVATGAEVNGVPFLVPAWYQHRTGDSL